MAIKKWIIGIVVFVLIIAALLALDRSGKIEIIWTSKEVGAMDLVECGNGYKLWQKPDGSFRRIWNSNILCDNNRKLKDQISYEITKGHVVQRGFNRAIWYRPYFERHGVIYTFSEATAFFPDIEINPFKKEGEYTSGYGVDISGLDSNPGLKYNLTLKGVKLENLTLEDIFIDEENGEVIYYGRYKDDFSGWFKVNESNFFLSANDKTIKFACEGNCFIDPRLILNGSNNEVIDTMIIQVSPDTNYGGLSDSQIYGTTDGRRSTISMFSLNGLQAGDTITAAYYNQTWHEPAVDASSGTIGFANCSNITWTELTLTWNLYISDLGCGNLLATNSTLVTSTMNLTIGTNLTTPIQEAISLGNITFVANYTDEGSGRAPDKLASSESTKGGLSLVIDWTPANNASVLYNASANETTLYANMSLRYNTTLFDANSGDKMNITGTLFVNDVGVYNITYATDTSNNTEQNFTIDSGNYSVTDTVIFQVNATDGKDPSLYYNSTELTVLGTTNTALNLTLDGIATNRIYEYETTANITAYGDKDGSICINFSAPDYGTNYTCDNPANISYKVDLAVRDVFNDSNTHKNITTSGLVQINLTDTTVDFASFNLTGFDSSGLPENISIDLLNNGTVDVMIPNKLNDTFIQQNMFTNYKINETLVYARSGSKQRYLNYSVNDFFLMRIQNITFNITGGSAMNEELEFKEYFHNASYINLTASNVSNHWIWEDFSIGEISGRWSGDHSVTANLSVGITSADSATNPNTCQETTISDSDDFKSETIDITDSGSTVFSTYVYASASGTGVDVEYCDGWQASGTSQMFLRDKTTGTNVMLMDQASCSTGHIKEADSVVCGQNKSLELRKIPSESVIELYEGTTYKREVNYDPDHQYEVYAETSCSGQTTNENSISCSATANIWYINKTGITGRRLSGFKWANSTVFSKSLFNFSSNITSATLTATTSEPTNTEIQFFLSPDNGSTFEEVTSGLGHVFTAQGSNLTWRADLNTTGAQDTGDYSTIPIIYDVEIEVSMGFPTNITVDAGYDGTNDWNMTGNLSDTASQIVTLEPDAIETYILNNCQDALACKVPISIYSDSPGIIKWENLTANTDIHGIELNHTRMTTNLSECTGNNCQIIVNISSSSGIVQISGVDFRYIGQENYTLFAFDAADRSVNATLYLSTRYSPFNVSMPDGVDGFYLSDVWNLTQDDITPFGQTIEWCNRDNHTFGICENMSTPIFNISSLATLDEIDIYVRLNETFSCINITLDDDVNESGSVTLNTTYQKVVTGIDVDGWNGTWAWGNLSNCSASSLVYYNPVFNISSICSDCVVTDDAF